MLELDLDELQKFSFWHCIILAILIVLVNYAELIFEFLLA